MKTTITIEIAMDLPIAEIVRIIHAAASQIGDGERCKFCYDSNGNNVGAFEVVED